MVNDHNIHSILSNNICHEINDLYPMFMTYMYVHVHVYTYLLND